MCTPPLSAKRGEGGGEPLIKFSKRGEGLDRSSVFRGGLLGKRGVTFFRGGCNFSTKNKLESGIFNDKTFINKNTLLCRNYEFKLGNF